MKKEPMMKSAIAKDATYTLVYVLNFWNLITEMRVKLLPNTIGGTKVKAI